MSESNRSGEEFVLQTNESENLLKSIEDQKRDELLALYQQVEGTDDTAKKVLLYTEWSKMHLERYLDIKDLTNIEAVHLRNTVEQLLPKLEEERKRKERGDERKSQVGTGDRSEKIRTYNYPQDRITDHRIKESWGNIAQILEGNLNPIFDKLLEYDQLKQLEKIN